MRIPLLRGMGYNSGTTPCSRKEFHKIQTELLCVFLVEASGMGVPYPMPFIAGTVNFSRQEQGVWKLLGMLWIFLERIIIIMIRKKMVFLVFSMRQTSC